MNATSSPLPASLVEDEVASRPRGGKRRALPGHRTRRRSSGPGKRACRDTETTLVNASDAAAYLATLQHFWTSTQILAHAEVSRMALEMARRDLKRQASELLPRLFSADARRERAEVLRALDELATVGDLLADVHRRNLIVGD